MRSGTLQNQERVTRLIIGSTIISLGLSGGYKTTFGKTFITLIGVASLLEGLVNQHLLDYFYLGRVR